VAAGLLIVTESAALVVVIEIGLVIPAPPVASDSVAMQYGAFV